MGLTNSEYEAVMREYDSIRYKNATIRQNRTKEVFDKVPELKQTLQNLQQMPYLLIAVSMHLQRQSLTKNRQYLMKKSSSSF